MPDEPKDRPESKWIPPYIAFKTLLNLLEKLGGDDGVPPQIDRTYLTGAEGTKTQVMNTLKSFDLTDEKGQVKQALVALAKRPDDRPQLIRELVERHYQEPIRLGTVNATQKMLDDAFEAMGVTGHTKRKAIGFYLRAAKYAGIPLSPNFNAPRESGGRRNASSSGRRRSRSKRGAAAVTPDTNTGETSKPDLKTRYIEMLMKMAQEQEQLDATLLDRIEKALKIAE